MLETALSYKSASYPTDTAEQRSTTLGEFASRSRGQNGRLDSYISGLEYLVARLQGTPTSGVVGTGTSGGRPTQPSAIVEVNETIDERIKLLDRLEVVCSQLDSLA